MSQLSPILEQDKLGSGQCELDGHAGERFRAVLQEAHVVDNAGRDALPLLQLLDGVSNSAVIPDAKPQEMKQLVVQVVDLVGIGARSGRDELRALAFPIAEGPASVDAERLASAKRPSGVGRLGRSTPFRRNFRDTLGHPWCSRRHGGAFSDAGPKAALPFRSKAQYTSRFRGGAVNHSRPHRIGRPA